MATRPHPIHRPRCLRAGRSVSAEKIATGILHMNSSSSSSPGFQSSPTTAVRHGRTSKGPSVCPFAGGDAGAAASVVCMPDDSREEPEDEFRDLLRQFLAGNTNIDPAQLASAAGLPNDPEAVER